MVKPVNFDALNELLSALEPHDGGFRSGGC
jgi:hypothetical protein